MRSFPGEGLELVPVLGEHPMLRLTCREVLHNAVHGGFDRRNLVGRAIERQRSARLDLHRASRGHDLVDRLSYRCLSRLHDGVVGDGPDRGLDLWFPFLAEARRPGGTRRRPLVRQSSYPRNRPVEETVCTTERLELARDRQIHMHFRRVPGSRRVPCFLEASRKPAVVETGCIEPEPEASDVLRAAQSFQQFTAAPVRELDRHAPLGNPSRPFLHMGIPLRKGRFLSRDAGVRQVHR